MKHIFLLLIAFFITCNLTYSTEQVPDLLIIGNDTINIKSFPLEELNFRIIPFQEGNIVRGSSAWRRGYQATWKVIGNKLFLIEMSDLFETGKKLDIIKHFKKNKYKPKLINGLIYADWYSAELVQYNSNFIFECNYLIKSNDNNSKDIIIKFDNGVMTENYYDCKEDTTK